MSKSRRAPAGQASSGGERTLAEALIGADPPPADSGPEKAGPEVPLQGHGSSLLDSIVGGREEAREEQAAEDDARWQYFIRCTKCTRYGGIAIFLTGDPRRMSYIRDGDWFASYKDLDEAWRESEVWCSTCYSKRNGRLTSIPIERPETMQLSREEGRGNPFRVTHTRLFGKILKDEGERRAAEHPYEVVIKNPIHQLVAAQQLSRAQVEGAQ